MTKREKRIKQIRERLSFYEGRLYQNMSDFETDTTESITSNTKHQELVMLNVAIEDLRSELDELESGI